MIVSAHYILASVMLLVGIAKQWHLSIVPWLTVQWIVILSLVVLELAEILGRPAR